MRRPAADARRPRRAPDGHGRPTRASLAPRRRRAATAPGDVRLSVVVPAFREAGAIAATVERIRPELAAVAADGGLEVVVVDDGSGDGTAAAAEAAGADQVIALPGNQGKGAAVRAGMLAATGRTRVFTDADLSYAPAQIVPAARRRSRPAGTSWSATATTSDSTTLVRRRHAPAARRAGHQPGHPGRAARPPPRHPVRAQGVPVRRRRGRSSRHSRIDGFAFDVEVLHLVERYGLSLPRCAVEVVNSDSSTVHVARDALALLGRPRPHPARGQAGCVRPRRRRPACASRLGQHRGRAT